MGRKQLFINELSKYEGALEFFNELKSCSTVSFVGGSVRNILTKYNKSPIKDFDFCIIVEDRVKFNKVLKNKNIITNRLGGNKVFLKDIVFDIWELNKTVTADKLVSNFKDLSESATINYDGIVYDFTNDILHDEPFLDCINNNKVKLINKNNLNTEYLHLKMKKLESLYNFEIDEEIIDLIS